MSQGIQIRHSPLRIATFRAGIQPYTQKYNYNLIVRMVAGKSYNIRS